MNQEQVNASTIAESLQDTNTRLGNIEAQLATILGILSAAAPEVQVPDESADLDVDEAPPEQEDAPPPEPPDPYPHLSYMLQFEGRKESDPEMESLIFGWASALGVAMPPTEPGKEIFPWCATIVGYALMQAGFQYVNSLKALDYQQCGRQIEHPTVGCLIIYDGHIGVCSGIRDDGTVEMVGGNQGDKVSITTTHWYNENRDFVGYFEPILMSEAA